MTLAAADGTEQRTHLLGPLAMGQLETNILSKPWAGDGAVAKGWWWCSASSRDVESVVESGARPLARRSDLTVHDGRDLAAAK